MISATSALSSRLLKKYMKLLTLTCALILVAFLSSCSSTKKPTPTYSKKTPYDVPAKRPKNINNVKVKVSLANRAVYVMEGDKPLLVTATTVGYDHSPTPKGNFKIYNKTEKRRKFTEGFLVNKSTGAIRPGKPWQKKSYEKYIGYPMGYWCEFKYAYGFHAGWVWPIPHSAGCLRLHRNVAPKFFHIVKNGTPVSIKQTQPEDYTIGKNLKRPTDYSNREHPYDVLLTDKIFKREVNTPLFVN